MQPAITYRSLPITSYCELLLICLHILLQLKLLQFVAYPAAVVLMDICLVAATIILIFLLICHFLILSHLRRMPLRKGSDTVLLLSIVTLKVIFILPKGVLLLIFLWDRTLLRAPIWLTAVLKGRLTATIQILSHLSYLLLFSWWHCQLLLLMLHLLLLLAHLQPLLDILTGYKDRLTLEYLLGRDHWTIWLHWSPVNFLLLLHHITWRLLDLPDLLNSIANDAIYLGSGHQPLIRCLAMLAHLQIVLFFLL